MIQMDRLPTFNFHPIDVAGSGDSLLFIAMVLSLGGSICRAGYLGSVAASIQSSRIGNIPLNQRDLINRIQSLKFLEQWKYVLDLSLNTKQQHKIIKPLIKIMKHGIFVMGPEINQFEKKISKFCNRNYCVSVGSGTDALYLALKSLNLKKNDEVITSSLSWIATANAIYLNNLNPVFADIDDDLNISPQSIQRLITNKTKAILTVNYTGKIVN